MMGDMMDPFGHANSMMRPYGFGGMNSLMMTPHHGLTHHMPLTNMHHHQPNLTMNSYNPASTFYCSSSVTTMTTDAHGRPQVYESTSSTRGGPGGTRETRSTVRDSSTGLQQMSIGHHIQDRGHVTERMRNRYTGEEEENEEFINIEDTESEVFENEWSTRMASHSRNGTRHGQGQLTHGAGMRRHAPQQLALTAPPVVASTSSTPSPHHHGSHHKNKMTSKKKDHRDNKDYKDKKWKRLLKKNQSN